MTLPAPAAPPSREARRILVFRIGSLGDTLVAVPSFWALRAHFPDAEMTLLCSRALHRIAGADVVRATGIFRDVLEYPAGSSFWTRLPQLAVLALRLRRRRFDAVAYLAPTERRSAQIARDQRLFRIAGIPRILGARYGGPLSPCLMPAVAAVSEADALLARLGADGVVVPGPGEGRTDLALTEADRENARRLMGSAPAPSSRPRVALGVGSNMPAKVWPEERYEQTVARLIAEYDVWPVIFGGPEDAAAGGRLIARWARGTNLGGLPIREAASVLETCRVFLGNDTGTMHLAAAAGVPCVALFSARDKIGKWFPYGRGHAVLRRQVSCEGCMLTVCVTEGMRCLMDIGTDEVVDACRRILTRSPGSPPPAP